MLDEIIKKGKERKVIFMNIFSIREIKMVKENIVKMLICLLRFVCIIVVG